MAHFWLKIPLCLGLTYGSFLVKDSPVFRAYIWLIFWLKTLLCLGLTYGSFLVKDSPVFRSYIWLISG